MPKEGFRSITVSEPVYNRFNDAYTNNKESLAIRGIRSLSGYISYMLEERMQDDETLATYAPRIKKISTEDNRVVLLDTTANRIAEVVVQNNTLFCQLCESDSCLHVGFAHALPEVGIILRDTGIKDKSKPKRGK